MPTQVIETRTETSEALGALNSLSAFYEDNTAGSRRQLRNTLEQRSLVFNDEFLAAAETINQVTQLASSRLCCRASIDRHAAVWQKM